MKLRLTFKTPDVIDQFLDNLILEDDGVWNKENIKDKLSKWIKYGEYITIEFDIDNQTATVIENKN